MLLNQDAKVSTGKEWGEDFVNDGSRALEGKHKRWFWELGRCEKWNWILRWMGSWW